MDIRSALRLCLVFLIVGFITNLIGAYTVIGIICCKGINYTAAVFLLLLTGYAGFYIFKTFDKPLLQNVFKIFSAVMILTASITCFARADYITEYDKTSRFFLALFISFGVYLAMGLFWPQILFFNALANFMQTLDADFVQIVAVVLNLIFSLICALFVLVPNTYSENIFVNDVGVATIGTVFINAIIGAGSGFVIQFISEKGYTTSI